MNVVPDASVAVEYLLRTPLGIRIAPRLESAALFAPELLDAEVLAVVRRTVLAGSLSAARAEVVLEDLRDWPVERVSHRVLLADAWILRENVTAYDALYVAVARHHEASILTLDGPLSRAPIRGTVVENVRF